MSLYARPSQRPLTYWCEPDVVLTPAERRNLSILAGKFIRTLGLHKRDGVAVTTFASDVGALFFIWVRGRTDYKVLVDTTTLASKQLDRHSLARLTVTDTSLNTDLKEVA